MTKKMKYQDIIVSLIFILYLTELFRFSVLFGISLSSWAAISTFALLIYILKNSKKFVAVYHLKSVKFICWFLLIVPLLFVPIHLYTGFIKIDETIRVLGNSLLYTLLLLSAIIFGSKFSIKMVKKRIIIPSAIIACFGLFYNYIDPVLFLNLKFRILGADLISESADLSQVQRVGGFYLKSTYAASCIIPLFFFLFPSKKINSIKKILFYLSITSVLVFVTGSRSMIIFMVLSLVFIRKALIDVLSQNNYNSIDSRKISNLSIIIILICSLIAIFYIADSLKDTNYERLGERVLSLTSFQEISEDNSVNERANAQLYYLDKIIKNPIVGYGPVYMGNLIEKTEDLLTSHNAYLENTLRYGIFYLILFFFMIYRIMHSKLKSQFRKHYFFDFIGFLIIYILYSSFASNTIWENKVIFIVLGLSLGLSYSMNPKYNRKSHQPPN